MSTTAISTNIFTPNVSMFSELCRILPELIYGDNNIVRRNVQVNITTINEFVVIHIQSIREFDNLFIELLRLRWSNECNTYTLFNPNLYSNEDLSKLAYHLNNQLVNINDIATILNTNPYIVSNWIAIHCSCDNIIK